MNATSGLRISVHRIFSVFAKKTRPYAWGVVTVSLLLVTTSILGTVAPLFYKKFFDALVAGTDSLGIAFWALVSALFIKGLIALLCALLIFLRYGSRRG